MPSAIYSSKYFKALLVYRERACGSPTSCSRDQFDRGSAPTARNQEAINQPASIEPRSNLIAEVTCRSDCGGGGLPLDLPREACVPTSLLEGLLHRLCFG